MNVGVGEVVPDGGRPRLGAVCHQPQEGDPSCLQFLQLCIKRDEVAVVAHHGHELSDSGDVVGDCVDGYRDIGRILGLPVAEVLYTFSRCGQLGKPAVSPYVPEGDSIGLYIEVEACQRRGSLRPVLDDVLYERLGAALKVLGIYVQSGPGTF